MSLRYLLDTNICIYIAKQKPISVIDKFNQIEVGTVGLSIITYGELLYGAQKSQHPKKALTTIQELVSFIPALPMPNEAGKYYGEVRSSLEHLGQIIGNNDLWIAAHALALDLIIVTNHVKEFSRIKHLQLENWVE